MNEEWRPVVGFEGRYEVSNQGRVRSIGDRRFYGWIRKTQIGQFGYERVPLQVDSEKTSHLVHRLVAQAFIENPDGLPCVNHKDFDRKNNRAENLEWCTHQQNFDHSRAAGRTRTSGPENGRALLNEEQVLAIRRERETPGNTLKKLAQRYGVTFPTIHKIVSGRTYRSVQKAGV